MSYRDEVWAKIAERRPEFTHGHDPFDDPWAVESLVLGESIHFKPFVGAKVMDIGANVGIWTAHCALGGAEVDAYEADPITFAVLLNMLKRTNLLHLVHPINKAVTYFSGACPFKGEQRPPLPGGPILRNGAIQVKGHTLEALDSFEQIPCVSFEEAIGETEWDFVKMDVEGAEMEIILSTPSAVFRGIKRMQIEFHNHWADVASYNAVIAKLASVFLFDGPKEADPNSEFFGRLHWANFTRS